MAAFKSLREDLVLAMSKDSIIGQYARLVVEDGTDPLRNGLRFACRVTGFMTSAPSELRPVLLGEVVSTDADGPLPAALIEASLIITPDDPDVSEARILEGGPFRARLGLVSVGGEIFAAGEGALLRISEEIPFEIACPDCQGWKVCEDCAGTGGEPTACGYCEGTGTCTRCAGTGSVTETN